MTAWATTAGPERFGPLVRGLLDDGGTVSEVADTLGYSTRQLQRRSRATFRYGPQHLARVLRLGRAVAHTEPDWTPPSGGRGMGLAFTCSSPAEVDATYAELTGAGADGHLEPWDAYWGMRYAVVHDPDATRSTCSRRSPG